MAHNLMMVNGKAAFFGTEAAWHKLGVVVEGAKNWEQAMNLALLNWQVDKINLIDPFTMQPIQDVFGIYKMDTKTLLGPVGAQYTPIQNKYAFDFVDALLEADSQAHYVSAGALGKGERIWCLAKINGESDITGTGDIHKHYLLFATSHDGSLAATCKLTTVRVVCNNTLTQALKLNGEYTRIKHTQSAEKKLEAARSFITGATVKIGDLETKLKELSKRIVDKESFKIVMKKLFGNWEDSKDKSVVRIENKIADVARLYESNDKNQFPEIRGTAYNLLNAITEYTDHVSGVRQTSARSNMNEGQIRAENALFGTGAALKSEALEVIIEATKGADRKTDTMYIDQKPKNGAVDNILSMVDFK